MTDEPRDPVQPDVPPTTPPDLPPSPKPHDPVDPPIGDPEEPAPDPVAERAHLRKAVGGLDSPGEQRQDEPLRIIGKNSEDASGADKQK